MPCGSDRSSTVGLAVSSCRNVRLRHYGIVCGVSKASNFIRRSFPLSVRFRIFPSESRKALRRYHSCHRVNTRRNATRLSTCGIGSIVISPAATITVPGANQARCFSAASIAAGDHRAGRSRENVRRSHTLKARRWTSARWCRPKDCRVSALSPKAPPD